MGLAGPGGGDAAVGLHHPGAEDDGTARIVRSADGTEIARVERGGPVTSVGFSPASDLPQADEAPSVVKRTVLVSPDLISRDRQRLIQKAMDRVSEALPRGPAPVGRAPAVAAAIELSDLRLYE